MALTLRDAPLISNVEYVLGFLYARPAERSELLAKAGLVGSPILEERGVEAALRSMKLQGLVYEENGVLILRRDRLHPTARKIAETIARDLAVLGVLAGPQGDPYGDDDGARRG